MWGGKSVLLTGVAGTGKCTLIEFYHAHLMRLGTACEFVATDSAATFRPTPGTRVILCHEACTRSHVIALIAHPGVQVVVGSCHSDILWSTMDEKQRDAVDTSDSESATLPFAHYHFPYLVPTDGLLHLLSTGVTASIGGRSAAATSGPSRRVG
jgi:hypothetical protein